ncbi:MAG: PKD domain-containing protein [Candidatus Thermoplasmatota archaeon]|nr:PKD domain-containing protein [Candidatus Thermoplasmatota archaeon]
MALSVALLMIVGGSVLIDWPPAWQSGDLDLFIEDADLTFNPSSPVELNASVAIEAEVHLKGGNYELQWTKKGVSLDLGGAQGNDDYHVISPRILKEGGLYKMWYSGSDGPHYRILYATSADGISWAKHGMVLDIGAPGEADDTHIAYHWVLKEGSTYKMWYSGLDEYTPYGGIYRIFYATSPDGISWTKHGVILDADPPGGAGHPLTHRPCILNDGGSYKMWYSGRDQAGTRRILYATSSDGTSWTKHGVVFDVGPPGGLEQTGVTTPFVVNLAGQYVMWYAGLNGSEARIFLATSQDGLSWTREGLVLDLGPPGSEDHLRLNEPFIEFSGGIPQQMWYAARGSNYKILRATASLEPVDVVTSVAFYLDGLSPSDEIGRVDNVTVPHNGSSGVSITWTAAPPGTHMICAQVDPDDAYDEADELNNTACREIEVVRLGPTADAGPDQTVYEGDVVQFNGSGSEGSGARLWKDTFDDSSKVNSLENTAVESGQVRLTPISFELIETFETLIGYQLVDDQPRTMFQWDSMNDTMTWHSDREDPADTFERLVRRIPFDLTDRFDFQAEVEYLYTMAGPFAEVYPLVLKYHGSYRSTSHFGATNNSIVLILYGGDPTNDRHSFLFWDGRGTRHEPMNQVYDSEFDKLMHGTVRFDSSTRAFDAWLQDDLGTVVGSGSTTIAPGSFKLTEFGVGAIGVDFGGVSEGYTDTLSLRAYGYPDGNVTSVLIEPQDIISWGMLSFNTTEPTGTNVTVDVLDEFGNPIISGLDAGDSPVELTGLIDPVLYPRIRLKGMLSTDRNETPSLLEWSVSYVADAPAIDYSWDLNHLTDSDGDGDFTNDVDVTGPTPTHIYGDNGLYVVTLTVTDELGFADSDTCNITVLNIAPSAGTISYFLNASFAFRIAGEKWHNVEVHLFEDGVETGFANITRYPGSPNEQMAVLANVSVDFSRHYSAIAYYTPTDDPVNGEVWGADPAWLIFSSEDGESRAHHTFNVRHEETWIWSIQNVSLLFLGHNITFIATASDPGSDDLLFQWEWGDGTSTVNVHYNDGIGPDPPESPEVNPIHAVDRTVHSYTYSGSYTIVLTVIDDDGGASVSSLLIDIG